MLYLAPVPGVMAASSRQAAGNAARSLYRTFLRQADKLKKNGIELEVKKPIQPDSWGTYGYSETGLGYVASTYATLLGPTLRRYPGAATLDATGLRQVVRDNFKLNAGAKPEDVPRLMSHALSAFRVLLEQLYLHRCSSSRTTEGVRVDATSQFYGDGRAHSGKPQNLFSYRIRVINTRKEPIQVLGREWSIKNETGREVVHVPHTPGNAVVGQKPIIPPGDCFEYVSGTDLDTKSGLQSGRLEVAVLGNGPRQPPTNVIMADVGPFAHLRPDVQRE